MTEIFFRYIRNSLNFRGAHFKISHYAGYLLCTTWLRLFLHIPKKYCGHYLNNLIFDITRFLIGWIFLVYKPIYLILLVYRCTDLNFKLSENYWNEIQLFFVISTVVKIFKEWPQYFFGIWRNNLNHVVHTK